MKYNGKEISYSVFIPHEFIDLNTYIKAERGSLYNAAKIKKDNTNIAAWCFINHRKAIGLLQLPLKLKFTWHLKDKKKDLDNVAFSRKFILDGLVKSKCLKNDGQKYITSFEDVIVYTKKTGVKIEFIET